MARVGRVDLGVKAATVQKSGGGALRLDGGPSWWSKDGRRGGGPGPPWSMYQCSEASETDDHKRGGLKQETLISSLFWARSLKSKVLQGCDPSRGPGERVISRLLLILRTVLRCIAPSLPLCLSSISFLIKSLVIGFGAHPVKPGWAHLKALNLIPSVIIESPNHVPLFVTPWTVAH